MNFKDNQAIYLQIAEYITNKIITGTWKPGDRIPSVRELASNLEVNPNTAMRSYTMLEQNGIITQKRGIGFFLTDKAIEITSSAKKEEFIHNRLPELFKEMDMLQISPNQLVGYYQQYLKNRKDENQ
jgi:GntR family transcriptional regulator